MLIKLIKRMMITAVLLLVTLVLVSIVFISFYPSFGGNTSKDKQLVYQKSEQFREGKFHNVAPVPKKQSFSETMKLAYKFFTTKVENGRPKQDIQVLQHDSLHIANYTGETRLIWFGHSSFLLQMEGKNILIDPMFGKVAAPLPLLGANRFNEQFPIDINQLPNIDAVILSHDHYDHLDYESILKIKDKTQHFYAPLGVGVHLEAWGVSATDITEMDWWQEVQFENLKFVCTPAQHFSGRSLSNGQSTLWSSWVIQTSKDNIYFSGDSGYAPHFKTIGEKFGPFDLALMECGQYNQMWSDIHMMPEETAQAGLDVQANKIMPIHWAGFKLALHEWTDPIKRVKAKAEELNLTVVTPQIGEEILVKDTVTSYSEWWTGL
jgi:L-ascorbate metabolism protein UlaG (beta-lactamase superfamily)